MSASTHSGAITAAPGPTAAARGGGPGAPVQSRAARRTSRDPRDFPIPSGREEEWRFTPLARLDGLLEPITEPGEVKVDVQAPAGVTHQQVPAEQVEALLIPADRVSALALAGARSAELVRIPAGSRLDDPVVIEVDAPLGQAYLHLFVEAGAHAAARVILNFRGAGTLASNTEVAVGDGADLSLIAVFDGERRAVHNAAQAVRLGRDSRFRALSVTLGGDLVRATPTVRFTGPGGDASLSGLFLTGAGQHHEHQLFVEHTEPNCRSRVTYKGALEGEDAHSVWVGDVHIGAAALGTDTYELNRNLVLTDGARADSVPNLEIETGEVVGAGHASATGRFDDEQLFYFMARGIPAATARRLVVRGFFAELSALINDESLARRIDEALDALLAAAGEQQ